MLLLEKKYPKYDTLFCILKWFLHFYIAFNVHILLEKKKTSECFSYNVFFLSHHLCLLCANYFNGETQIFKIIIMNHKNEKPHS